MRTHIRINIHLYMAFSFEIFENPEDTEASILHKGTKGIEGCKRAFVSFGMSKSGNEERKREREVGHWCTRRENVERAIEWPTLEIRGPPASPRPSYVSVI